MLQQEKPDDYVVGTGENHSVREFLEESAKQLGMNIHSNGKEGIEEQYVDENGNIVVKIHPRYFRPAEVDVLLADATKARAKLGWEPKIRFKELIGIMTKHDLKVAEEEKYLRGREEVAKKALEALGPLKKVFENYNLDLSED